MGEPVNEGAESTGTVPLVTALYALTWVLVRLAFMAYQMTLAFWDIFIHGFRHEIGLAEYVTKRVGES